MDAQTADRTKQLFALLDSLDQLLGVLRGGLNPGDGVATRVVDRGGHGPAAAGRFKAGRSATR